MKKKRPFYVAFILVLLLGLLGGCGSNKHLNPSSELVYHGAEPASMNVAVSPPRSHTVGFLFSVQLSGTGLSMVKSDAWIIDRYQITYTLISDPGEHLSALPADDVNRSHTKIASYYPAKVSIPMVTDNYLADNASGFIGTADTARVKAHVVFHAHRVKDGKRKIVAAHYFFNIGDY